MDTEPSGPSNFSRADETPPAELDYNVLRLIGRGGYGEVWLVRDKAGRYFACKVIYRASFDNDRPYEREYEGIRKFEPVSLANDSQVNILHIGRNDRAGFFYYLMELADDVVHGQTVDPVNYVPKTFAGELKRRRRLPAGECVRLGLALSAALENLHEHGLIHRDIKPGNIIFVNGIPKLADIGLVTDRGVTVSFVGTEGYVPPEGPGSAQGDVYGLGKVLYELGTGKDRLEYPDLPTDLGNDSERDALLEFNTVVVKACEQNPRKRYRTAAELHADLTFLSSGRSLRQRRKSQAVRRSIMRAACVIVAFTAVIWGIVSYQKWRSGLDSETPESLAETGSYPKSASTSAQLSEICIRTGFEAWDHNDFPRAKSLAANARAAGDGPRKLQLLEGADFLETEASRCEKEYSGVKPMFTFLKEKPGDPKANLAVGSFLCFEKNDWQGGLPLLLHGEKPALRAAAQNDLTGQNERAIGDAWWNLAQSTPEDPDKIRYQHRARTWYLRAIAKAKGPSQTELRQELADRIKPPTTAPFEIHLSARVANSLHFEISPDEVRVWNDGAVRGVKINYVPVGDLSRKSTRIVKNTGATRLYPEDLDFTTAQLKIDHKGKKRDNISLHAEEDRAKVSFNDKPRGSSQMEATVIFGAPMIKDESSTP